MSSGEGQWVEIGEGSGGIRDGKERWQRRWVKSKLGQHRGLAYTVEGKRGRGTVEGENGGKGVRQSSHPSRTDCNQVTCHLTLPCSK